MASIKEYATFFRQFREQFETTGAIAPSSRFLARSMCRWLKARPVDAPPARILEIGPGTGAVTREIVRHVRPGDRFDLVELNGVFANTLRQRFQHEPHWKRVADQSQVHECPIQEFPATRPYDFVISGLPLNNFPEQLVAEIFEAYLRLLGPGGTLSYFEYQFVRSIRMRVGAKNQRTRLSAVDAIMQDHCRRLRIRRDWIFPNLPPAWVQHLRKDEATLLEGRVQSPRDTTGGASGP